MSLAISGDFLRPACASLCQPVPACASLCQPVPACASLCQPVPASRPPLVALRSPHPRRRACASPPLILGRLGGASACGTIRLRLACESRPGDATTSPNSRAQGPNAAAAAHQIPPHGPHRGYCAGPLRAATPPGARAGRRRARLSSATRGGGRRAACTSCSMLSRTCRIERGGEAGRRARRGRAGRPAACGGGRGGGLGAAPTRY